MEKKQFSSEMEKHLFYKNKAGIFAGSCLIIFMAIITIVWLLMVL